MALTPSTMLALGTIAPDFTLADPKGNETTLRDGTELRYRATLIVFMCNHCPYVVQLKAHLAAFARRYMDEGVRFIAINANDSSRYPDDSPEKMQEDIEKYAYPFPYLHDKDQQVAKAYNAACTPDFYLFDSDLKLFYRGQYDDARPGNGKRVTGMDLSAAIDAVLAGKPAPETQKPSMGCSIKWHPGNAPEYAG